ncbi:hypothetical protein ACE939_12170 [Aquimarina sp. W85]|uniref:hypothetical protein n=1 Tax=Aquimarina rhodophyticola TaxID=3342246 RepID=UPI0036713181
MSKDNYDSKQEVLANITNDQILTPGLPIDTALQEAEDLYHWATQDQEALTNVGLDLETYVTDLPIRAGALRYAQSQWYLERYNREEAQKEWDEQSPTAYALRNELLQAFRFAFRKRSDLIRRVGEVADGTGHADMIQDLSDLSALGKDNVDLLETIKFDTTLLNKAATDADAMAELLAKANGSVMDNSEAKMMRDKTYTHMKEAVDEIRQSGKYAFRKQPERYQGYVSRYYQR